MNVNYQDSIVEGTGAVDLLPLSSKDARIR